MQRSPSPEIVKCFLSFPLLVVYCSSRLGWRRGMAEDFTLTMMTMQPGAGFQILTCNMIVMGGPQETSNCTAHYPWSLSVIRLLHPALHTHPQLHLTHKKLICICLTSGGTAACSADATLTCFSPSLFSLCSNEHRRQSAISYVKRFQ